MGAVRDRRTGIVLACALGVFLQVGSVRADPGLSAPPRLPSDARADLLARAKASARAVEADLARTVERARQASVTVLSHRGRQAGAASDRPQPLGAVGSGVLVSWRGTWVVTSLHVVDGEEGLEVVTNDGHHHGVRIRASSKPNDLALLAFDTPPREVRAIGPGDFAPAGVREGTWVVATGNPFFLALDGEPAASLGVLSGARPPDASAYLNAPTIQHDAEINPGSSGGPLWNRHGQLVGINGTIATRSQRQGAGPSHTGASFSVPASAVRTFLQASLGAPARGVATPGDRVAASPGVTPTVRPVRPVRPAGPARPAARVIPAPRRTAAGRLGVRFRTARDTRGLPSGAAVSTIESGSPAATANGRAGLRPGDLVTLFTISGKSYRIRSADDVQVAMRGHAPGTALVLHYQRAGQARVWAGYLTGS